MSQTVTLKVAFTDNEALRRACIRMNIAEPVFNGTADLFDRKNVKGTIIALPDWSYPLVIKRDGAVDMDNYHGHWGSMDTLDQFSQYYVIEAARIQAEQTSGICTETPQEDGSVELLVEYINA